ncbi:MAG: hypothetical protein NT080_00825 [Spirochaetes bacterium]|nr:hypothetical protein [Spirochaetota bacterium]
MKSSLTTRPTDTALAVSRTRPASEVTMRHSPFGAWLATREDASSAR